MISFLVTVFLVLVILGCYSADRDERNQRIADRIHARRDSIRQRLRKQMEG